MAWLPLFGLGLRILGLRRWQAWLRRAAPLTKGRYSSIEAIRIAALVNIAAAHSPIPATCLTRSLLLEWMLRRRGVASEIRIGVRLTQGVLDAHAWVESEGIPINDRPDVGEKFVAFAEFPPPAAFHSP